MRADFFDTNIILYLLDDGPKADMAAGLLAHGGVISVQVLNEALVNWALLQNSACRGIHAAGLVE